MSLNFSLQKRKKNTQFFFLFAEKSVIVHLHLFNIYFLFFSLFQDDENGSRGESKKKSTPLFVCCLYYEDVCCTNGPQVLQWEEQKNPFTLRSLLLPWIAATCRLTVHYSNVFSLLLDNNRRIFKTLLCLILSASLAPGVLSLIQVFQPFINATCNKWKCLYWMLSGSEGILCCTLQFTVQRGSPVLLAWQGLSIPQSIRLVIPARQYSAHVCSPAWMQQDRSAASHQKAS